MKNFTMAIGAAIALAGVTAPAQAQTSVIRSNGTTTTAYSGVQSEVLGSQMGGMRISATYENCSTNNCQPGSLLTASGIWQQYGLNYGVNLMNGNTQLGTVRIGASTNTFNNWYTFDWTPGNDFRTLKFEGGIGFGHVIFDIASQTGCGSPSLICAGQTTSSSTGMAFDIEDDSRVLSFDGSVTYSNPVRYQSESLKYDVFTTVEMTFVNSSSGPDSDQTPFRFKMDTDLGVSVVPEPSTYALMAAGLAGIFGFARRRNRTA